MDIRWYSYLREDKDGMFKYIPKQSCRNKLIVCKTGVDDSRHYAMFDSFIDFGRYYYPLSPQEKTFFEVALDYAIKPYFDIDQPKDYNSDDNVNPDDVVRDLWKAIESVASTKDVQFSLSKDICLYCSSNAKKQSFHLVINNWCFTNYQEAKAFAKCVVSKMSAKYMKWVDMKVYKSLQQFRMIGSSKPGAERYKVLVKKFKWDKKNYTTHEYPVKPDDEKHEFMIALQESLIGFTDTCQFLPSWEEHKPHEPSHISVELHRDEVDLALDCLAQHMNMSRRRLAVFFSLRDVVDGIINLQRLRPTFCSVCGRTHENENPYLRVVCGQDTDARHVHFNCRRTDESQFVGSFSFQVAQAPPSSSSSEEVEDYGQSEVLEHVDQLKLARPPAQLSKNRKKKFRS